MSESLSSSLVEVATRTSFERPEVDGWGLAQMIRTSQSVRRTRLETRERARTPFPEKGEKLNSKERSKIRFWGRFGPIIGLSF